MSLKGSQRITSITTNLLAASALMVSLAADASDKQIVETGKTAKASTLKRIFANWHARQERTKSFHFAFESRRFSSGSSQNRAKPPLDSEISRFELWIDENSRFRFDYSFFQRRGANDVALQPQSRRSFDGKVNIRLEWLRDPNVPPQATIWGPDGSNEINLAPQPLLLAFRPFDPLAINWRPEEFYVITDNAIVDNVHCAKIQRSVDSGKIVENCWVDPTRDDVIVVWEKLISPRSGRQTLLQISIQYQHEKEHGWVPASWTMRSFGRARVEDTVTKFTINERIPIDTLTANFPPGTVVFDKRANRGYIAVAKGSKNGALNVDSIPSPNAQQALDAKVDFEIEPQPLLDALEFIHQRCNVPMEIDREGFDNARIDISMEVQANLRGRKVRELLSHLLAECPKPVGFEVQKNQVVISPIRPAKRASLAK